MHSLVCLGFHLADLGFLRLGLVISCGILEIEVKRAIRLSSPMSAPGMTLIS